jgi:hypothetical protein
MVVDLSRKTRLVFDWSTSCFEDSTRTIQLLEPWSQRIERLHGQTWAGRFLSAVALDSEKKEQKRTGKAYCIFFFGLVKFPD